jgi:hypothetical protein
VAGATSTITGITGVAEHTTTSSSRCVHPARTQVSLSLSWLHRPELFTFSDLSREPREAAHRCITLNQPYRCVQQGGTGGSYLRGGAYEELPTRTIETERFGLAGSSLYGSRAGAYRNLPSALELRGHFRTRPADRPRPI